MKVKDMDREKKKNVVTRAIQNEVMELRQLFRNVQIQSTLQKSNKKGENSLPMGDLNVCWEEMSTEGEDSCGNILLAMIIEHTTTQWITENARFRHNEEPLRLDIVFMKEPEIVEEIKNLTPIGKAITSYKN